MINIDIEERAVRGAAFFKSGLNCSQSVVAAFADIYNLPHDIALKISASFGGGIGRMRLTCGTVCGMFILAGLENGSTIAGDTHGRGENYALVQKLAKQFESQNGSITCATLLGLRTGNIESTTPSERTVEYYKGRPCIKLVEDACRIYAQHLINTHSENKIIK